MEHRFKNRPNTPYEVAPGKTVFDSRSVALLAMVLGFELKSGRFHVLAGRRGRAVDLPGHWCMVCGYLDWDESLEDAARREVFEEAGLDLAALEAAGLARVPSHPTTVRGLPGSHRQNVTAEFPIEIVADELPVPSTAHAEPDEVDEVAWIELTEENLASRTWAFHHDELLGRILAWLTEERQRGQYDRDSVRRYFRAQIESRYPFV
ncbi:MAG: NUDIX hydrolase [Polyangiaceae bacterium]